MTTKKAPLKKSVIQKAARRARLIKAVQKAGNFNVELISILMDDAKPANGCPVLIKSVDGDKDKRELKLHILKKEEKEGLLYATSMEPGKVDKQNDVTDAAEIKKMAHAILEKGVGVDVNHNLKKTDTRIAESFILRGEDPMYPGIAKGSHCLVFKLGDDLLAKADKITGISVYGSYDREPLQKDDPQTEPGIGPALKAMRVKAGVGDVQVATALGLTHQEYSDLEADTADIKLTADQLKAVGKILKIDPLELAAELLGGAAADENAENEPPADGSGDAPPDPKPNDPTTLGKSNAMTDEEKKNIKKEKTLLKSGTIHVKEDLKKSENDGDSSANSSLLNKEWKPTTEDVRTLRKNLLGLSDDGRELLQKGGSGAIKEALSKGDIVSTDFVPGGSLSPEVGRTLLSLIRDQSSILKKINIHEVHRRDAEVLVTNFKGALSRQAIGPVGSGAAEGVLNNSIKVSTAEVDLLLRIPNRTIDEYRNDLPGLEQLLLGMAQTGFANKLMKLCFMGTSRTYVPPPNNPTQAQIDAAEMTLAQGFFDLAVNGSTYANGTPALPAAQIIDISSLSLDPDLPMEIMDAMRAAFIAQLPEFNDNTIPYLMGPTDFFNFEQEIKQNLMGLQLQINGVEPKYGAHPIEQVNYIPTQNYLLTPYANLGLAILNSAAVDGGIKVQVSPIRKAVEWLFTIQVDPFLASPVAIVAKT